MSSAQKSESRAATRLNAKSKHFSHDDTPKIDWQDYALGEHRIQCPECSRNERDKTCGLKVESGGAVAHCFRCSYVETFRENKRTVHRVARIHAPRQQQQKHTSLSDWGRALWDSTHELSGIAEAYLRHRNCVLPPKYGDLRWHPALKHPSGHVGPALVALVTDIHTNQPLSLHRTWITATGKAALDTPRLPLANHSLKNGVIRLWPDEDVSDTLGIAEGIETALSLAWAVQPAWACIDAGHLKQFPVLPGITQLYIGRDNDQAGIDSAAECAQRWADADRFVMITKQQKNDINDVVGEQK